MAYSGIQMFMDKLNQLINCNDNSLFNSPEIICERPQFQLLYQELGSMSQTLFRDEHQDLEKVNDLKKRFIYAAEEAQDSVDLFLSSVHVKNNGHFPASEDINRSLNLDDIRKSLKSVEVEFTSMCIDSMKTDSSPRLNQSATAQISIFRNSLGLKKLTVENFVGIERDAELIRDKLVEDQKKLVVVSIVGMGGIGKTTLANKVFNDGYVKHHFFVRVWVTVSQTYDKRAVLIQILESIKLDLKEAMEPIHAQLDLEEATDYELLEMVHKRLFRKRYLIVIDDIWHIATWDNLKSFFPHDNTGSRILLTTRLTEVAKHANSDGFIHHLECLNKIRSWELLCQKVFHGIECPEWSIKPGMQIAESCHGLPLAVIVIAGVLAKERPSEEFWVEIVDKVGSYIVGEHNGCLEILGLSYNHLPLHLRECFLYLGGFPEDYEFHVQRLIWLWVAEGFIQKDGNRSLEDIAEGYLMDLIDRNLVIVDTWKSNGDVKTCKVHDLVRELCLKKAKEEQFILKAERLTSSYQFNKFKKPLYKPVRMFIDSNHIPLFSYSSAQSFRSLLVFDCIRSLRDDIAKHFSSFVLLRVLDLQKCELNKIPEGMEFLVHLRYLAINYSSKHFPSSICNLWSLQTLILYVIYNNRTVLPSNISNLVNLRHLGSYHPFKITKTILYLPSIEKPMNLQTISDVELGVGVDNFQKCFPYIKELTCRTCLDEQNDFKSLTYLEKLHLIGNFPIRVKRITFPTSLKTLKLELCGLPWSNMSIIQSLPNLQLLKLGFRAFEGRCWNTDEHEFQQLKFLILVNLDIQVWKADSRSFPCLRQLEIKWCSNLEEIPLEIGDIPTLELIQIKFCSHSVGESVRRIEEEQRDFGNYDLVIDIIEDLWESD